MAEIDVLLPVRAPAPWIGQAIQSVANQTLADHRIVFAVHASDRELEAVIDAYQGDSQVVAAPKARTLGEVLNTGLSECSAPFVARMDADDHALPERFHIQHGLLCSKPEVAVVGSSAVLIDEVGHVRGLRSQAEDPRDLLSRLRWRNALVHSSVMFRRSTIMRLGGYSPSAPGCEDYELWLRVAASEQITGVSQPLQYYRMHDHQESSTAPLSPEALRMVRDARMALARARGESLACARARQFWWGQWQKVRARRMRNLHPAVQS